MTDSYGTVALSCVFAGWLAVACSEIGCEPAASTPAAPDWRSVRIGQIGFGNLPKGTNGLEEALASYANVRIVGLQSGARKRWCIVYYPSPDGESGGVQGTPLANVLKAAFLENDSPGTVPRNSLTISGEIVDSGTESDSDLLLEIRPDGITCEVWYVHPFRHTLECFSPERGPVLRQPVPESWFAETWGSENSGLRAMAVDGQRRMIHFILLETGSDGSHLRHVVFDIRSRRWQEGAQMQLGSTQALVEKGQLRVLSVGKEYLLYSLSLPQRGGSASDERVLPPTRWSVELVEEGNPDIEDVAMTRRSFFAGSDGQLYILESDQVFTTSLKLRTRTGSGWTVDTVATNVVAGSAVVMSDGKVHAAWYDPQEGQLIHGWKAGGRWHYETVGAVAGHGIIRTSIGECGGEIAIAYVQSVPWAVCVAYRSI